MSASPLCRLGRRLLPLAQRLDGSAGAGWSHPFSSAANEAAGDQPRPQPASGAGRGGPGDRPRQRGPPGGHRGPRGGAEGGPQRPMQRPRGGAAGGGAPRQPGAMSQLLQQGGGGGGGDRRPFRGPPQQRDQQQQQQRRRWPQQRGDQQQQQQRPGQWQRRGPGGMAGRMGLRSGEEDWREPALGSMDLSRVPPSIREIISLPPADFLTRAQAEMKDEEGEWQDPADVLGDDVADVANMDQLALFKYLVSEREWDDFKSGRMGLVEQNDLADKLAASLLANDHTRAKEAAVDAAMEADPDYDLEASLGSQPALRGSPRPKAPSAAEFAAGLEEMKEEVMEQCGVTEEEFEESKGELAAFLAGRAAAEAAPVLPDHLEHAARLQRMLDRALPRDHPQYRAAADRLAVLQGNPGWPQERKMVFAKRLLKRLAAY